MSPTHSHLDAHLRDELTTILLARRDNLTRQLALIEEELPGRLVDGPDQPSTAAAARVRSVLADAALADVDAALERLRRPDFGRCETCQADIAAERLLVLPDATECAGCAR